MNIRNPKSLYGIIGWPLKTTFSPGHFNKKFSDEGIDAFYETFPIEHIEQFPTIIQQHPNLCGLNVTIPHKQSIIPFLHELDDTAEKIGAVNCIRIRDGKLKGYNTDTIGFMESLKPLLQAHHNKALILGTGGASKAVAYALTQLNIPFQFVSRTAENAIGYNSLSEHIIDEHKLIINTTPLGMVPDTDNKAPIPYQYIGTKHLLFDLIYKPEITAFLQEGIDRGAQVKNGYEMWQLQAEAGWRIWGG